MTRSLLRITVKYLNFMINTNNNDNNQSLKHKVTGSSCIGRVAFQSMFAIKLQSENNICGFEKDF